MQSLTTEKKIKEVTDKIVREFQPEKIILFGSHAWGEPHEDSDVDLFIVKDVEDVRACARSIDRALTPRKFPTDILVYSNHLIAKSIRSGNLFIENILANGKVLYAR